MNTSLINNSILPIHMGAGYQRLAPLLQQTHVGKKKLEGIAQVTRGNWIARIICAAFRFPKEESNVHLRVECEHSADAMTWKRDFNGLKMASHFHLKGDYIVEHLGPLALHFKVLERNGELHYQFVKTIFWGIPLPNILSPQVQASEREHNGQYHFSVVVTMFLIGNVIAYNGELSVQTME